MKEAANGGGPSCKHQNQPDSDQGVYASDRHAQTNIGRDALRRELDLLAEHGIFPAVFPARIYQAETGESFRAKVQKCT
jgi:hypothetical protein